MLATYQRSTCQEVKQIKQKSRHTIYPDALSYLLLFLMRHGPDIFHHTEGLLHASQTTTLTLSARGATVAPSECCAWLGWQVCCSYGRRLNSCWLPVCLFLVSVYLWLTPCRHVKHRHLPPGHIAEQASFLAGWPMSEKIIFSQRFKGRYAFRILSEEELKWWLKNKHVLQLLPLQCLKACNEGNTQTEFATGPR